MVNVTVANTVHCCERFSHLANDCLYNLSVGRMYAEQLLFLS